MSDIVYKVFYNSRPEGESPVLSEYDENGFDKAYKDANDFNGWILDCRNNKCVYDHEDLTNLEDNE